MRSGLSDAPETLPDEPLLRRGLLACDDLLGPAFEESDVAALGNQARHRVIVRAAAIFGTAGVIAALTLEAVGAKHLVALDVIRYGAGAIALVAIVLGLVAQLQRRWHLRRHIAERLSLLKYQALLQLCAEVDEREPESFTAWEDALRGKMRAVRRLPAGAMRKWATDLATPFDVSQLVETPARERLIRSFREFYCRLGGRLRVQEAYFRRRSRQYDTLDTRLRSVVPLLFLGGVALSFVYAEYPLFERWIAPGSADALGRALSAGAAGCIALAAMIKVLRTADEYARNTLRFSAVYHALEALRCRVTIVEEPRAILGDIGAIEAVLEDEHREWLRLMIEADWH